MASCRNKAAHDTHFPAPSSAPAWQRELQQAVTDPVELLAILGLGPQWLDDVPGYGRDPVGDLDSRSGPGVLHTCAGRLLLLTTGTCAMNCRYCFRRHFPYEDENASRAGFAPALAALRGDASVRATLARLAATGSTLLNQSVPLRGIKDDTRTLAELSETQFAAGVLPYYLHLLDRVAGAAHFAVPENEARRLWSETSARLRGYLVPRRVREIPGAPAKTMLPPASR